MNVKSRIGARDGFLWRDDKGSVGGMLLAGVNNEGQARVSAISSVFDVGLAGVLVGEGTCDLDGFFEG